MPRPRTLVRHGLLTLCLALASLSAAADDDCDAPSQRWQTREAVRQMAAQQIGRASCRERVSSPV